MEDFESFPYTIEHFESVIHDKVVKVYKGQPDGFVQVGPEKYVWFKSYKDFAGMIYNLEVRHDDVLICTHPRSGTTWTQEIVWLICNDLNYDIARNVALNKRFPFLERHLWANDTNRNSWPNLFNNANLGGWIDPIYNQLSQQSTPRFVKTHLPIKLLPRNTRKVGAKIVYVARNPKDVAVSYYYLHLAHPLLEYKTDFESFVEYFMNDLTPCGPYWQHVLDGWSHRNDENVFFLFYEDLKFETELTLRKLSAFLGKPISDDELPKLLDHLDFENFKKNPSINFKIGEENSNNNGLVRRGKVGGNPEMSKEISKMFDDWTQTNLKDSDLRFPHCNLN